MIDIEDTLGFLIFITLFCGGIALLLFGVNTYENYKCAKVAEITEKEYRYSFVAGCFFKEDGKWVKDTEENADAKKVYLKK